MPVTTMRWQKCIGRYRMCRTASTITFRVTYWHWTFAVVCSIWARSPVKLLMKISWIIFSVSSASESKAAKKPTQQFYRSNLEVFELGLMCNAHWAGKTYYPYLHLIVATKGRWVKSLYWNG